MMSKEGSGGEWFEELPHEGRIYQLIERSRGSEQVETRILALRALGESGDPRAVRPLIDCTDDKNAEIRKYATEALLKLHSARGVEALNGRLKDRREGWATRKLAADALGEIRSHRALEVLSDLLQDASEDLTVREYVATVLARTGTETGRHALERCRSDESPTLRKIAEDALSTSDFSSRPIGVKNWITHNGSTSSHKMRERAGFRQ
jgi:HEAT repeat protein